MDEDRAALQELTRILDGRRRQLRHEHDVHRLMGDRDDLRGVSAMADLVDESVRWSA